MVVDDFGGWSDEIFYEYLSIQKTGYVKFDNFHVGISIETQPTTFGLCFIANVDWDLTRGTSRP